MPLVTEEQALEALSLVDLLEDPAQKAEAVKIARSYEDAQRLEGKPLFPKYYAAKASEAKRGRALFQDDRFGFDEDTFREFAKTFPDEEKRARYANNQFLARALGKPSDEVRALGTMYRDEYAKQVWGEAPKSDLEFYGKVRDDLNFEDEIAAKAYQAALAGAASWEADSLLDAYAENQTFKGRERAWRERAAQVYAGARSELAGMDSSVDSFLDGLRRQMGVAEGEARPDEDFVSALMDIPKEKRGLFLQAVAARGGEESVKGLAQKMGERFGRGATDIIRNQRIANQHKLLNEAEGRIISKGAFDSFDIPGILEGSAPASTSPNVYPVRLPAKAPAKDSPEWDALTPDQKTQLEEIETEREKLLLWSEVNNIATGAVDPAKGGGWIESGLIGLSGMVPNLALMAAGPVGISVNVRGYQGNRTAELLAENPGMDTRDALAIGQISGIGEGLLDYIPTKIISGSLPFAGQWLKKATLTKGGLIGRASARLAGGVAFEFGQEMTQDVFLPGAVQELAGALREDVPGVDWDGRLAAFTSEESLSELIPSIILLSLIGAGVGGVADYKNGWQLVGDRNLLVGSGISEADADAIVAAAERQDAGKAQDLLRDAFAKIDEKREVSKVMPEARKAALQNLVEEANKRIEAIEKGEATGIIPAVGRTADGWTLRFQDGTARTFETHAEADAARWKYAGEKALIELDQFRGAVQAVERQLEQGREVVFSFAPTQRRTLRDAVAEGEVSEQAALNRAGIAQEIGGQQVQTQEAEPEAEVDPEAEYQEGYSSAELQALAEDDKLSLFQILGSNKTEFADGVQRTTVKLFQGATPLTVIEEKLEGDASLMLAGGRRDWLLSRLRRYERMSGEKILPRLDKDVSDVHLKEAYSHLGQSYLVGRSRKSEREGFGFLGDSRKIVSDAMRSGLGSTMEGYRNFFRSVWKRAAKLNKMRREGKLDAELEAELARSVGLGEQAQYEASVEQEATGKLLDEVKAAYSPIDDAPFSVVSKGPDYKKTQLPDGATLEGPATFSVIAYHGTPHKVDKFSLDKIGTGEGAQAYGWGLYFAVEKAVANQYKVDLSERNQATKIQVGDVEWSQSDILPKLPKEEDSVLRDIHAEFSYDAAFGRYPSLADTIKLLKDRAKFDRNTNKLEVIERLEGKGLYLLNRPQEDPGNLYTVELLPDDSEFLDWDKPLSEQSDKVREALRNLGVYVPDLANAPESWRRENPSGWLENEGDMKASRLMSYLDEILEAGEQDPKWFSETLNAAGIPGIRYLDGNSRDGGKGTSNYVIFDESLVRILEKNGQPVEGSTSYSTVAASEPLLPIADRLREWAEKDVDERVRQVRFTDPDTGETSTFGDVADDFALGMSEEEARKYVEWLNRIPDLPEPARDIIDDINWMAGRDETDRLREWNKQKAEEVIRKGEEIASENAYLNCEFFCNKLVGKKGFKEEFSEIEEELFDSAEAERFLLPGDVLGFGGGEGSAPRHYAVYIGEGRVYEVAEWGAPPRIASVEQNLESYELISKIYREKLPTDDNGNVIPLSQRFNPARDEISYSVITNAEARIADAFNPYFRNPEQRRKILLEVQRRAKEKAREFQEVIRANRTNADIDEERKRRQEDIFTDKLGTLSPGEIDALSAANLLGDDSIRPILANILREKTRKTKAGKTVRYYTGSLLSKSEAQRRGMDTTGGEWDDIPEGLPPYVWGGSRTPDQAATEFGFDSVPEFWDALIREIDSYRARKEEIEAVNEQIRDFERQSREEAKAWAEEQKRLRKTVGSDRATLIAAMRTLDAMISGLPAEIRGKIGGMVRLAQFKTPGAMLAELERRAGKLDTELERWLRKEADKGVKKLFETAKPAKDQSGKKRVGKAGADIHDLFDTARQAWKNWTAEQAEAHAVGIEDRISKGEMKPEDEAHALLEAELVRLFGGWNEAGAERKNQALETATEIWREGYHAFKLKKAQEKERRDAIRADLIADTGSDGLRSERDIAREDSRTFKGKAKSLFLNLLNFEQLVQWTFGKDSVRARWFADQQRRAENAKIDAVQKYTEEVEDLFAELAGGNRFKGEQLHFKMMEESIEAKSATGDKVKLSQLQGVSVMLMWQQEDGQRHMKGKRDEDGNLVSKWSYDSAFVDEVAKQMTPEAWRVLAHLQKEYGQEYEPLNAVYREIYGINLPRNANYSPLTVKPQTSTGGQTQDPVTGSTVSSGSFTPGSLRTRAQMSAEPDFTDAVATFIGHKKQIEHWKSHAKFVLEANAVLGNRDVRNAVEASSGKEAVSMLGKWIDALAQGGTRDASAGTAMQVLLGNVMGRFASMALVGRIGTLAVQSTQLAAASASMPSGSYIKRLGKLFAGQLGWGAALRSEYIQRRIDQAPVMVQAAMKGLEGGRPTRLKHEVRRIGQLIGGADAFFTAGTFAIVHDYQFSQAKKSGLSDAEADAFAMMEAERIVENLAQPTRMGTRSYFEISSTNPIVKIAWAFGSDARKNFALLGFQMMKGTPAEKGRALLFVVALNGLIAGVIRNAWRDLRDDEDEDWFDDKYWNPKRLLLSTATDWAFGFPVIGEAVQNAAFSAFGEYVPDSGPLSALKQAPGAAIRLSTGESESILRDAEKILTAAGLASDNAAAATSLMHIIRDVYGLGKNLIPD